MNKTITVSILTFTFIGGFLFFYKPKPVSSPTQNNFSTSITQQKWELKTDDQANVTVTVVPSGFSLQTKEWKFDIVMDTHSVELDQDLTEVAVLVDDGGKEYKPIRWEGPLAGGHHREGTLIFAPIMPYPQHLTLRIKDIGDAQRSFSWTLIE